MLCEKQRAKLTDSGQRAREVEHTAAAARERADLAEKQVKDYGHDWNNHRWRVPHCLPRMVVDVREEGYL